MKLFLLAVWEIFEVVLIGVVTVFFVRNFLAQPFLVSGASMEPNFSSGNYLLIDEVTYRFREPERGEVTVFRYPENPSVYYIKRMIGLPLERIVVRGGEVKIYNDKNPQGFVLNESYLPVNLKTAGDLDITVPKDEYFVLGDNRNYSYDSRSWGFVPKKDIVGIVRLRLLPINEAKVFTSFGLVGQ